MVGLGPRYVTPGSCSHVRHVLRGLCSPDESREHKLHDMSDSGFKMRQTGGSKMYLVKLADSDSFL
jgi:hypothetical protein